MSRGIVGRAMPVARVLIADDHPVVLERLVALLNGGFEVVEAVTDGRRLLEAAAELRPDVVVTDLSMPGLNGLEVLSRLKAARSSAKVIVLTMYADADLATEALRLGASGFILKLFAGDELVAALNQVLQGGVYMTRGIQPPAHETYDSADQR